MCVCVCIYIYIYIGTISLYGIHIYFITLCIIYSQGHEKAIPREPYQYQHSEGEGQNDDRGEVEGGLYTLALCWQRKVDTRGGRMKHIMLMPFNSYLPTLHQAPFFLLYHLNI